MPEVSLSPDQLSRRASEAEAWFADAAYVDSLAKVPESTESLEFLQSHAAVAVMYDGGISSVPLESTTASSLEQVRLLPVFPEDSTRLTPSTNPLKERVRSMAAGEEIYLGLYVRKFRILMRKLGGTTVRHTEAMSSVAQGFNILHEGHHARLEIEEKTEVQSQDDLWNEEALVRSKEFAIAAALGGTIYASLVEQAAESSIQGCNGEIVLGYTDKKQSDKLWSDVIGNHISQAESKLWYETTVLNGVWEFCQQNSNSRKIFAKFLSDRDQRLNEENR